VYNVALTSHTNKLLSYGEDKMLVVWNTSTKRDEVSVMIFCNLKTLKIYLALIKENAPLLTTIIIYGGVLFLLLCTNFYLRNLLSRAL